MSYLSVSALIRVIDLFSQMKREYNTILDDADSANRINSAQFQRDLHDQGHPMNLFLKIFVLQANFCWLGDLEKKMYILERNVAGK